MLFSLEVASKMPTKNRVSFLMRVPKEKIIYSTVCKKEDSPKIYPRLKSSVPDRDPFLVPLDYGFGSALWMATINKLPHERAQGN
jgi:hypothetical protein